MRGDDTQGADVTTQHDGGEDLAPVIPLFGAGRGRSGSRTAGGRPGEERVPHAAGPTHPTRRIPSAASPSGAGPEADAADGDADAAWHTTWRGLGAGRPRPVPTLEIEKCDGMRQVRFADVGAGDEAGEDGGAAAAPRRRDASERDASEPDASELAERAERRLVRSLGTRGLSVVEARSRLVQELPRETADAIVERLQRMGALDDARLAEQLIHTSLARKKQGRRAIAQSLSTRGIPREVIDAALAELPDDDAERALEFARGKARQLARYDDDTALRRLVGQLARRGFGGSVGMSAARRALLEVRAPSGGAPSGGVRFE